jgi:hypothetical protein
MCSQQLFEPFSILVIAGKADAGGFLASQISSWFSSLFKIL